MPCRQRCWLYYYDQAASAAKSGDTLRATDMAREALRKDANHVQALLLLAKLWQAVRQCSRAIWLNALSSSINRMKRPIYYARALNTSLKNIRAWKNA
ncbi:MAG: hypothetical protein U1F16_09440 [Turneriella sp.]